MPREGRPARLVPGGRELRFACVAFKEVGELAVVDDGLRTRSPLSAEAMRDGNEAGDELRNRRVGWKAQSCPVLEHSTRANIVGGNAGEAAVHPVGVKAGAQQRIPIPQRPHRIARLRRNAQLAEVADAPHHAVSMRGVRAESPDTFHPSPGAEDKRSVHRTRQAFGGEVVRLAREGQANRSRRHGPTKELPHLGFVMRRHERDTVGDCNGGKSRRHDPDVDVSHCSCGQRQVALSKVPRHDRSPKG